MPPARSAILTEAELRLMNVLWEHGPSTVQQVLETLPKKPALAYNSVLTTIRILERKGYVEHAKDGRAHVYAPLIGRQEASRSEIKHLVQRFFGSSQQALVLNILEEQQVDQKELQRLQQMLSRREDKER